MGSFIFLLLIFLVLIAAGIPVARAAFFAFAAAMLVLLLWVGVQVLTLFCVSYRRSSLACWLRNLLNIWAAERKWRKRSASLRHCHVFIIFSFELRAWQNVHQPCGFCLHKYPGVHGKLCLRWPELRHGQDSFFPEGHSLTAYPAGGAAHP